MKTRLIILMILASLNSYSQVKSKLVYTNMMGDILVYKETENNVSWHKLLIQDARYVNYESLMIIYEGDDLVGFLGEILIFANTNESGTYDIIDGAHVTIQSKNSFRIAEENGIGYRFIGRKRIEKIIQKIQDAEMG